MQFHVNDKVLFKKEKLRGLIIEVLEKDKVRILTSDNFEMKVSINDIILLNEEYDNLNAYGDKISYKDKAKGTRDKFKNIKESKSLKVDLHIEFLMQNHSTLSNAEIINIQKETLIKKIDFALFSNYTELVVVHGIGSGVLKNEVHSILEEYKLRYYLSQDGGATFVML